MKTKAISLAVLIVLITSVFASGAWAGDAVPTPDQPQGISPEGVNKQEAGQEKEVAEATVTSREMPLYFNDLEMTGNIPVYFINGVEDLPYVDLKNWVDVMVSIYQDGDPGYGLTLEMDDYTAKLTRENGYSMLFDFQEGTILFDDYDAFIHSSGNSSLIDMISASSIDEKGNTLLIKKINEGSFDRYGSEVEISLPAYQIHDYYIAEKQLYLVPLQIMGHLLVSLPKSAYVLYNQSGVYIANDLGLWANAEEMTPLGKSYYSSDNSKEMSQELAWFNYCELCLVLDHFYGLKEIHDITSFDRLFSETGYKMLLASTDPNVADNALSDFIYYYLDDLHSGYTMNSYRADNLYSESGSGLSSLADSRIQDIYKKARDAADHPIPTYEEVGNTAYITFDKFDIHNGPVSDYYEGKVDVPKDPAQAGPDTIALIIYAHKQICRENSPVENVVLDLSLNEGGFIYAAAFVASWFLGETALSIRSSMTGAISTATYLADTNLDRVFDERDTVADKNLFCLIGPYSFSAGNLVPNLLKSSHKVTLLGKTTGGGSCSVLPLATADGAMFKISSPYRMSYLKNGSYYDTDRGIDPDIVITKTKNFYDREALTKYINGLF